MKKKTDHLTRKIQNEWHLKNAKSIKRIELFSKINETIE